MNDSDTMFSFFFCIGCQKSGTTLFARVLDQHPQIACIWESYALMPEFKASVINPDSESWKNHGFSEKDVRRWALIWSPAQKCRGLKKCARNILQYIRSPSHNRKLNVLNFRNTMSEILIDFGSRCKATVVGDKWPLYIDHLDILLEAFPNARFIYNVRDPRALWNSAQRFKNRKWGDIILAEMLDKDRRIEPYLQSANFLTIRYEDFVCDPERTCRQLYSFLGCEFSENYLIYDPESDLYPKRWEWIPEASEPFNPLHTIKWKRQMRQEEIMRVTMLASWFIEKYHYEYEA